MKQWIILIIAVMACSMITAADEPMPSPEQIQQQAQRIQNARRELERQRDELQQQRRELDAQRHDLEMQRQDLERQRDQIQPQRTDRLRLGEPIRPERARLLRDRLRKMPPKPFCVLVMMLCAVVHILVAVWVFQDIRTRGVGSGLWIVIALIAGLLGALVYAVVRLGDVKK